MNATTSSIIEQASPDQASEPKSKPPRKARHAWSEAPNGLDVFLKNFSVVSVILMVAIMLGILVRRLIG